MKITYIGHSCVLIQTSQTSLLTDPLLVNSIFPVKFKIKPTLKSEELQNINVITISHAHTDHLNLKSLKQLNKQSTLVLPLHTTSVVKKLGFKEIIELKTWENIVVQDLEITSVPVNHVKGRFLPWSKTEVASYVIKNQDTSVLIAGDVDFGDLSYFEDIGKKFDLKAVFLPIGGMREVAYYEKRRGKKNVHIDPQTALEAFKLTKADLLIPIHWGMVSIAKTSFDEAPKTLIRLAKESDIQDKIKVLYQGDTFNL